MPSAPVSLMPALRRVIAGHAAEKSDADLVTAFVADRDPEAFAALVRRHGPMVLGVCRRVVRDPDAADDAFQAVFLVLARRAGDVRPRNRVGGWLYGVAYRTALKARAVRARRRTRESQVDAIPEPAAPPAADGWDDLKPILDEELARLPDRLRVPVVLCDLEGRPQRAVAGQLGIAPATLAGRLADARRTLAARLTRRGVALSAAALGTLLAERGSAGVVNPHLAAGVVKAAEVVAAGGAAAGLVSANALQLCDGVMRMIFLTKLKTAAGVAVAVLALAGGVGPGLVPALAQDARPAAPAPTAKAGPRAGTDDAAFLDRICLELRGSKGTPVEHGYFAADADAAKRHKVTNWLLDDPAAKAHLGGWKATARVPGAIWLNERNFDIGPDFDVKELAFSADGRFLSVAGTTDTVVVPIDAPDPKGAVERVLTARFAAQPDAKPAPNTPPPAAKSTAAPDVKALKLRIDSLLEGKSADDKKTAPAPGEPIRVKVVTVNKDEKSATIVTEDGKTFKVVIPPPAAKQPDGKNPAEAKYLLELFEQLDTGKKADGKEPAPRVLLWAAQPPAGEKGPVEIVRYRTTAVKETDAAFLRRAVTEARGTPPTAIEERYFAADADPKKREKLLDALLADPAAARRVGESWKQRMLAPPAPPPVPVVPPAPAVKVGDNLFYYAQPKALVPYLKVEPKAGGYEVVPFPGAPGKDALAPMVPTPPVPPKAPSPPKVPAPPKAAPGLPPMAVVPPTPPAPPVKATVRLVASDRWPRLVGELIAAGKTDEQILEGLTLAAAGRLPTDIEKRLTLATIPTAGDRSAAWAAVARALAGVTPPAPPPLPKSKE